MAKRNVKRSKPVKTEEELGLMDENEKKTMEYMFFALFAAAIVFLLVYLAGFVNILLR